MNKLWRLARKPPGGWPVAEDFAWSEEARLEPQAGQALSRTIYISMDPYQWGRRRGGVEQPGDVCHGRTVAQVVASRHVSFEEGDYVFGTNGWQRFGLTGEGVSHFNYMHPRKLDPELAPLSTAIGIMGMLGLTAYSGMIVQCEPQKGETVVVSAASGGVGQVAGQLAKLRGARVVGIAGKAEKCDFVCDELGFDACVSHLDEDFSEQLRSACPDGCDVYFENVGGKVYAGVLPLLNKNSRITVCGMISQYGNEDGSDARQVWDELGAETFAQHNVAIHNLFVGNFVDEYQDAFLAEMGGYVQDNLVTYKEDLWEGLERAPEAFMAMLQGGNFGKTIVVADSE
ncbi:MAG: zinc-binding dehydrogenase [Pseudomonadales bacterium]|nr:zinc-binding dehydrogenase [Pseudomonadales bacterium]